MTFESVVVGNDYQLTETSNREDLLGQILATSSIKVLRRFIEERDIQVQEVA